MLGMMKVNHRRILCAMVIALWIFGGRVMKCKEETDKIFVIHFWWIVTYMNYFDMTRHAGGNLTICRIGGCIYLVAHEANSVAQERFWITLLFEVIYEVLFGSPVTARAKGCVIFIFMSRWLIMHGPRLKILFMVTFIISLGCLVPVGIDRRISTLKIGICHSFMISLFEKAAEALIEYVCLRLRHYY